MYITAQTLDDLLAKVFSRLLTRGSRIEPTKGPALELPGVLLRLNSPRARLSRTDTRGILFSCLGELLWYLEGSNRLNFIKYYIPQYDKFSDDDKTIFGGYGPRIFGSKAHAQIHRVIDLLINKNDSRQAVVQIFDRNDLMGRHRDIPCTCTLQFMIRDRQLNMLTTMRSNDAYLGLPHDFFAFTMLQELVARAVGVKLGHYKHFVGSLHLYETDHANAIKYLREGGQPRISMPPMPQGNPWKAVGTVLSIEEELREQRPRVVSTGHLTPYWKDLERILEIFSLTQSPGHASRLRQLRSQMSSDVYAPYIRKRVSRFSSKRDQLDIFEDLNEK